MPSILHIIRYQVALHVRDVLLIIGDKRHITEFAFIKGIVEFGLLRNNNGLWLGFF